MTTPSAKAVGHTALPWEVNGATHIVKFGEDYASIAKICNPRPENEPQGKHGHIMEDAEVYHPRFHEAAANAAFIVRACNSHYQLLSALKAAVAEARVANVAGKSICSWPTFIFAEKVLAQAEEGL